MYKFLVVSILSESESSNRFFINTAGNQLQTQINLIPELQSEMHDLNQELLIPVGDKNSDMSQSLRQIQSVIDNDSEIHHLISKNQKFLDTLSSTNVPAAVARMESDLTGTKADLLRKQEQVRLDLESDLDAFYEKVNSNLLPNFTTSLVNMTSDSIRNVSRSIRAIEQFRNQTYANNASDIDDKILFAFAPRQGRDLVIQKNILEKNRNELRRLEHEIVPQSLTAVNSTVRKMLEDGVKELKSTLNRSETEAEQNINVTAIGDAANLDSLLDSTRIDLSSQVSTQVVNMNLTLNEMKTTILAYSNLETRAVGLLKALRDQLKSVEEAKQNTLVNTIYPITKGLGSSVLAAKKDFENAWDEFSNNLKSKTEEMKTSISNAENKSVFEYKTQLEKLYSDLTDSVDKNVGNLVLDGNKFVESVQKSLSSEVAKMLPQSDSMSASIASLMTQTSVLLGTAREQMYAKLDSINSQNEALFSHTNGTFTDKLKALRDSTNSMNLGFEKSKNDLDEFYKSSLSKFDSETDSAVANLTKSLKDSVDQFQSNLVPWPAVDADKLNTRVKQVEDITKSASSDMDRAEKNMDLMTTKFSQETDKIPNSFVHDTAIVTSLTSDWHKQLDAAGQFLREKVQAKINETKAKNDYIGTEIGKVVKTITDQFSEMNTVVDAGIKRGPEPPTMADIETEANQVATSIQSNSDRFNDVLMELRNEFSRNVSRDDSLVKANIDSGISNLTDSYLSAIASDMSGANVSAEIASLMSKLSSELTYSSALSGFKQSLQTADANSGTLEADLQDKAEEITNEANSFDSLVNMTIVPSINSEVSRVSLLSDKVLNQSGSVRIDRFIESKNLEIDSRVNQTKLAISGNLAGKFRTTLNGLSDYIDYVSRGSSGLGAQISLLQHETKSAAIQLHSITDTNEKMVADSAKAEEVGESKNEAVLRNLLTESKKVEKTEKELEENSDLALTAIHQVQVASEYDFVRNLTLLGHDIVLKIQNLTKSHSVTDLEEQLGLKNRDARLRNGNVIKQVRDSGARIINGLNSTGIEGILTDVGSINNALNSVSKQIHDVVASLSKGVGDSRTRIEANEKTRLLEAFTQFDELLEKIGNSVPAEVKKESEQALSYIRDSFEEFGQAIAAHKFPTMVSETSLNLIARDELPNIETAITRSRSTIKDTVKFVKPNKNFEEEFNYMRGRIDSLKQKQRFKQTQIERIHRYFDRDSNS